MINKNKQVICDSCQKEIVGEPTIVYTNRNGWGVTRTKDNHFHKTAFDCAEAVEPVKIWLYKAKMSKREEQYG